jgi:hypothetical protein
MNLTFLCLANSRKLRGKCVAGIRLDELCWFRPINAHDNGELYPSQYTLNDGTEASILDIIRVDVSEPRSEPNQPENWLLLDDFKWQLIDRINPEKAYSFLKLFFETDEYLFGNPSDCLQYATIESLHLHSSLCLIEPSGLRWEITKSRKGKRQTRAQFTYNGINYDLVVTDPEWEAFFANLNQGAYVHDDLIFGDDEHTGLRYRILFTLSLGVPYNGNCYKLVAGVICLPRT